MSSNTNTDKPVELWVTAEDNGMQYSAWIAHADETISDLTVTGRSMQSAQRHATDHPAGGAAHRHLHDARLPESARFRVVHSEMPSSRCRVIPASSPVLSREIRQLMAAR
ncbi:MAG: hypothetical protein ACRDRK_10645 [Pseudonocardia sp.]